MLRAIVACMSCHCAAAVAVAMPWLWPGEAWCLLLLLWACGLAVSLQRAYAYVGLCDRPYTTDLGPNSEPFQPDAFASFSPLSFELMFIFEYGACKFVSL